MMQGQNRKRPRGDDFDCDLDTLIQRDKNNTFGNDLNSMVNNKRQKR